MNPLTEVKNEVTAYFEALGYETTWDFKRSTGEHWHEICDDEGLVAQIDMGVPLTDIVEDVIAWYEKRDTTTNGKEYTINLPPGKRANLLLKRVAKRGMP